MKQWLLDIVLPRARCKDKRSEAGIAYVEFALILPVLIALFMGSVEVTRYILVTQKTQKVAMTVADVVAQAQTISTADLANIVLAGSQIMQPYTFGASGYIIISSVTQTGTQTASNPPKISWQYTGGGSMNPAPASRIGVTGGAAILPNNIPLNSGDNIIVTEVYYNYTPLLVTNGIVGNNLIYQTGLYKPRLASLSALSMLYIPAKGEVL